MNLAHYVEEIWTELSYEEGIIERTITLPISNRENYQPLPWVKEYIFFELDKTSKEKDIRLNVSPTISNQNYNPLYYMAEQPKGLEESKIKINLAHYVKEIWIEVDYSTKTITEREITLPIKNREDYNPGPWVKKYNFVDFLTININGKIVIDKTPLNETSLYLGKTIDSSYPNFQPLTNNAESITPKTNTNISKRKILTPFQKDE